MKEKIELKLRNVSDTGQTRIPNKVLDHLALMMLNHYRDFLFAKGYRTESKMNTLAEENIMWFRCHQFRFDAEEKDKAIRSIYKLSKQKVLYFDDHNYGCKKDLMKNAVAQK